MSGQVPERFGKPQVVANEQAGPHTFDVDGYWPVPGPVLLVFPSVGERVQLVVVVVLTVRTGHHHAVDR